MSVKERLIADGKMQSGLDKRAEYERIAAENAKNSEVKTLSLEEIDAKVMRTQFKALQTRADNMPKIFDAFPYLQKSKFCDMALNYIFYSSEHQSIAIANFDECGIYHYEKIREKFIWDKTDPKKWLLTNERMRGSKWIKNQGASIYPFPLGLFYSVWDFGHFVICEGEKDAINLNLCGIPAITLGSTSDAKSWHLFLDKLPVGVIPILFFDNDKAGEGAKTALIAIFEEIALEYKAIFWESLYPDAQNKADASDWLFYINAIELTPDEILTKLLKGCEPPLKTKNFEEVANYLYPKIRPLKARNFDEVAHGLENYAKSCEPEIYDLFLADAAKFSAKLKEDEKELIASYDGATDEDSKQQLSKELKELREQSKKEKAMCLVYKFFGRSCFVQFLKHQASDAVYDIINLFLDNGFALMQKYELPYFWCGTHWQNATEDEWLSFVLTYRLKAKINIKQAYSYNNFVKEVFVSSVKCNLPLKELSREIGYINHQGGTIVVDINGNIKHKEHDKNDNLQFCLNIAYDKNATAPLWQKFLNTSMPDIKTQMVMAEYIGYCFLPIYAEEFLYLLGQGSNGKSVFLKVIEALFSESLVSHLNIEDMKDHMLDSLTGKLLNISPEVEANAYISEQIRTLKSIVVGEAFEVNPKFRPSFTNRRPPKILIAGNDTIQGGGLNDGFARRLLLVPFDVTITKEQRISRLAEKIIDTELAGVLNWAIEGMKRFIANGNKFTISEKINEANEEYKVETNPIYAYIKSNFEHKEVVNESGIKKSELVKDADIKIPTGKLYEHYCYWCKKEGKKELNQKRFTSLVVKHLNTKTVQLDAKTRYFVGFRFNSEIDIPAEMKISNSDINLPCTMQIVKV